MGSVTRGASGPRARQSGVLAAVLCLVGMAVLAPQPQPAAALTAPLSVSAVGHSPLGTVLTSTQDHAYAGRFDLVDDGGTLLHSRTLPQDPTLDGVSVPRNFSFCADTVTSLRSEYDIASGTQTKEVTWYSLLGDRTGTGTVTLADDEQFLTSAPGGWVTATSDAAAGTAAVTYRSTSGATRSLGTVAHPFLSAQACDEESVVVLGQTYQSATSLVRVPFDGSGPVVLRTEPQTTVPFVGQAALAVDGEDVLATTWDAQSYEPSFQGATQVWRLNGTTASPLVTGAADSRVISGGIGPLGAVVCFAHPDQSGGCDTRFLPTSGDPSQADLPEASSFWPTQGGFLLGCDGTKGTCVDLYRVSTPTLSLSTVYRARQPLDLVRWGGADRYEVAARISEETFWPRTVPAVFLTTGSTFGDALGVGAQGARLQAPMLLTTRTRLPASVERELVRLNAPRIYVIGGTGAVSDKVAQRAAAVSGGAPVTRLAGGDRYATAAVVSKHFFADGAPTLFVVSGESFPDGLVAAAPAAQQGAPILLTRARSLPAATLTEVRRLAPSRIVVVGGPGVVSENVVAELRVAMGGSGQVERVAGTDRYETAVAVARGFFPDVQGSVYIASGADFPDALAMGPATFGSGPILLTGLDAMSAQTAAELQRLAPTSVRVAGGPAAVAPSVMTQILELPDLP